MARTYQFIVGAGEAGVRIDQYLTHHLPTSLSRNVIQRAIRAGQVTVAACPVKAHTKLRAGESVVAHLEHLPARSTDVVLTPQSIPVEIVYEDADLLVVNKPAGLVTHPAPGHWEGTLVNAILWHLGYRPETGDRRLQTRDLRQETSDRRHQAQTNNEDPNLRFSSDVCGLRSLVSCLKSPVSSLAVPRAGIVHRLDKDTSGLLIVAKTTTAHTLLSRQLKARRISRRYLAVVEGHLERDEGTVTAAISRHPTHRKVMSVRHLGGRHAVTHYRVMKRDTTACGMRHAELGFPYTVVQVSLETGRTHQIRVHMAHVGHPVAGDVVYGKRPSSFWESLGIHRQLLHAYAIHFLHPSTHQPVALKAPLPEDFTPWCPPSLIT